MTLSCVLNALGLFVKPKPRCGYDLLPGCCVQADSLVSLCVQTNNPVSLLLFDWGGGTCEIGNAAES